jgi:hypothetical protein
MTRIALVETNRGFRRGDFEDANGEGTIYLTPLEIRNKK